MFTHMDTLLSGATVAMAFTSKLAFNFRARIFHNHSKLHHESEITIRKHNSPYVLHPDLHPNVPHLNILHPNVPHGLDPNG